VCVAIVCTASNASTLLIGQQIGNMVFIKPISVIPKRSFLGNLVHLGVTPEKSAG